MRWTTADIPPQHGRTAIVTGANSGIGYETGLALAGAGAEVVLAVRSAERGAAAAERIRARHPDADVRSELLDLGDLASVHAFADRIAGATPALHLLVNNAGVMALPRRELTTDGFERQLGVNFLGHFALTARLLPLLRAAQSPRVVQLSSLAHLRGRIDFADLQGERRYTPWRAYTQSKLAMLLFALELDRRSRAHGWDILSNAAHPGWAATDLIANGMAAGGSLRGRIADLGFALVAQSSAAGALPTLYAATAPEASGGGYYGPLGPGEIRGAPGAARIATHARDPVVAARLWQDAERLTGIAFPS